MYSWFPRNRCAIAIILCIPPLIGCFVLLKLPASAGWGVVVSSWLVSVIILVRLLDNTDKSRLLVSLRHGLCCSV